MTIQTNSDTKPVKKNEAAELLANSVEQLMNSDTYKAALKFKQQFHLYSFRNSWLIYLQRPDASMVSGYNTWKKFGRQVKKGEKGIKILAPLTKRLKNEDKPKEKGETIILGFKTANVFALEQTEGEDIPELPRPKLLESDSEEIQNKLVSIRALCQQQGFPVEYQSKQRLGSAMGSFTLINNIINIRDDLPPLQQVKTLLHELAHGMMHKTHVSPTKHYKPNILELEAESCAYLTCLALGLDTSDYSFAYLAGWADEPNEVLLAADKASKVSTKIIESLSSLSDLNIIQLDASKQANPLIPIAA